MKTAIRMMFLLLLAGRSARAESTGALSIVGEDDRVIVTARGATPKNGQVRARGMWIDIDLTQPAGSEHMLVDDPTFKRLDLNAGVAPKLSLLLHRDMKAEQFAAGVRVEVIEDGMRVFVPRDPRKIIGEQSLTSHAATDAEKTVCRKSGALPGTTAAAPPAARLPVEALGLAPSDDRVITAAIEPSSSPLMPALALVLLIAGSAVALLMARRRKQRPSVSGESIRVLSQTSVAPKVKLMLIAVGDREVLISVSDSGARAVGRWRHDDVSSVAPKAMAPAPSWSSRPAAVPAAALGHEPRFIAEKEIEDHLPGIDVVEAPASSHAIITEPRASSSSGTASSPAVAGLLRLRRPAAAEHAAGSDPRADDEWAQELLAAMRGQGAA